jgi:branched-chain amino acid transport system substrate-binding protein
MVGRRLLVVIVILIAAFDAMAGRAEVLIGVAGPMTGTNAWFGEQMERGTALAVADLNAASGVLGEQVQLSVADDFCDPEQAVAAAKKLVSDGVILVVGHFCSGASIPGSEIYAAAGVLQIFADLDQPYVDRAGSRQRVFRVTHRDDAAGMRRDRSARPRRSGPASISASAARRRARSPGRPARARPALCR